MRIANKLAKCLGIKKGKTTWLSHPLLKYSPLPIAGNGVDNLI